MTRTTIVKVVRQRRALPAPVIVPVQEPEPLIWSERECCEALQIGETKLRELRRDGLPAFTHGRMIRFVAADVVLWMKSRYEPTTIRRSA